MRLSKTELASIVIDPEAASFSVIVAMATELLKVREKEEEEAERALCGGDLEPSFQFFRDE